MFIILWAKFVGGMSKDRFEVVVHHSGHFASNEKLLYDEEETITWFSDLNTWSYFKVVNGLKKLGHVDMKELWHSVRGESVLKYVGAFD